MGKGTNFKVYLPASPAEEGAATKAGTKTQPPRGNGELLLVVDDDESIRAIAKKTLERFGYRVVIAGNGAEAVAVYAKRSEEIALVLTDMEMPVMDGIATLIALKAINPEIKGGEDISKDLRWLRKFSEFAAQMAADFCGDAQWWGRRVLKRSDECLTIINYLGSKNWLLADKLE